MKYVINNPNDKLLLVGDFNFKEIDWQNEICTTSDDHIAAKFLKCVQKNYLFQHVKSHTHFMPNKHSSLIDLVLTNEPNFVENLSQLDPIGASHHNVITFMCNISSPKIKPVYKTRHCMNKGNYHDMRVEASELEWNDIFDVNKNVDEWWDNFEITYNHLVKKHIPTVNFNQNKVQRTFTASDCLLTKIQSKRKAYKYYKRFRTTENYQYYTTIRNDVTNSVKKAKLLKEIELAKISKSNPKAIYQYVSSKSKVKESIPDLESPNGEFTKNDSEKAHVLNTFFGSVFTHEDTEKLPECDDFTDVLLSKVEITNTDVFNVLTSLNVNKSPGPDGVHPRVLKELAHELSAPLKTFFDKTMKEGKIPQKWKIAEVKPIFKKGNKNSPNNYRPVSLTCIVCKIFEQFVRNALYKHLTDNDLLALEQFGFCQGRSCTTQLLVTINDWLLNIDKNVPTDAVYLDFSKAFDCVPHRRLMTKLHAYGIRGDMYNWIKDFYSTEHNMCQ